MTPEESIEILMESYDFLRHKYRAVSALDLIDEFVLRVRGRSDYS